MSDATEPTFGPWVRELFGLDPAVTYLNHGTVGVAPRRVLLAQQRWREQMERQPSAFLLRELVPLGLGLPRPGPGRLREAAAKVAAFVGSRSDDLVFVDNATAGANAVLRSLDLRPGDEILLTDHTYGAVANAAAFVARERQAQVRTVEVPYPAFDAGALQVALEAAMGPRTRLLLIDHITSESALVLPVAEIAARARAKGVSVLVDGAHAPGALPLDVPGTRGRLLRRQPPQVGLRAQGIRIPLGQGREAGRPAPAGDLVGPRQGLLRRVRLGGHARSLALALGPGGDRPPAGAGPGAVRKWNHDLAWAAARGLTERWDTPLEVAEASVGTMVTAAPADRPRLHPGRRGPAPRRPALRGPDRGAAARGPGTALDAGLRPDLQRSGGHRSPGGRGGGPRSVRRRSTNERRLARPAEVTEGA